MLGFYLHSGYLPLLGVAFMVVALVLCALVGIKLNKSWRDKNPK